MNSTFALLAIVASIQTATRNYDDRYQATFIYDDAQNYTPSGAAVHYPATVTLNRAIPGGGWLMIATNTPGVWTATNCYENSIESLFYAAGGAKIQEIGLAIHFSGVTATNTTVSTNFWVKESGDASGWPFKPVNVCLVDGSVTTINDTAFDAAMRRLLSTNTTVYVGPGTFKTRGACGNIQAQNDLPGFRLQDHSRLIGSGKDGAAAGGTTLRLVGANDEFGALVVGANAYRTWFSDQNFTWTTSSGIWVTDLELDCNAPEIVKTDPSRPWYLQGVQITGTNDCHIERVHVKNACAMGEKQTAPTTENFSLCINSPPGISVGNMILNCSVTDFYNPSGHGACSAISMNRWGVIGSISGTIADCDVTLNGNRGWGFGGEFAYNAACANGLVITNCTSVGAQRGFNNDTWPNWNLIVAGNRFDMPPSNSIGILLLEENSGSRISLNVFTIRAANSSGILIDRVRTGNNLLIDQNQFLTAGQWKGVAYSLNLNDNLSPGLIPINVHLERNSVTTSTTAQVTTLAPATVGYMEGNKVNGVEWLWPVLQPNKDGWKFPGYSAISQK